MQVYSIYTEDIQIKNLCVSLGGMKFILIKELPKLLNCPEKWKFSYHALGLLFPTRIFPSSSIFHLSDVLCFFPPHQPLPLQIGLALVLFKACPGSSRKAPLPLIL